MTTTQDRCEKHLDELSEDFFRGKPPLLFIGSGISQYLTGGIGLEFPSAWNWNWARLSKEICIRVFQKDPSCGQFANWLQDRQIEDALEYALIHDPYEFKKALRDFFWNSEKVTLDALQEISHSQRCNMVQRLFNASGLIVTTNLDPLCAFISQRGICSRRTWRIRNASSDDDDVQSFFHVDDPQPRMLYLHGGLSCLPAGLVSNNEFVGCRLEQSVLTASKYREAYPLTQGVTSIKNRTRVVTEVLSHYRLLFLGFSISDYIIKHLLGQIHCRSEFEEHDDNYAVWTTMPDELTAEQLVELERFYKLAYGVRLLIVPSNTDESRSDQLDFIIGRLLELYESKVDQAQVDKIEAFKVQ
jgi:hypothetical protein